MTVTREEVLETVKTYIYGATEVSRGVKLEDLTEETTLEDVGLDSLDTVSILFDLEGHYDVELPVENADVSRGNLGVIVDVVHKTVNNPL